MESQTTKGSSRYEAVYSCLCEQRFNLLILLTMLRKRGALMIDNLQQFKKQNLRVNCVVVSMYKCS